MTTKQEFPIDGLIKTFERSYCDNRYLRDEEKDTADSLFWWLMNDDEGHQALFEMTERVRKITSNTQSLGLSRESHEVSPSE